MRDVLKTYIKGKDHYYIIGVYTIKEQVLYNLIEVALEDEELILIKRDSFTNIKEAKKKLINKDYPILLNFDGENIISRELENQKGYRNSVVFKMNPDDFYFYEYAQDNKVYLSLSRKNFIDDTLKNFNKNDKYVIHMSIGPFVLSQLHKIIDDTTQVSSGFHRINFNKEGIESFEKTEDYNYRFQVQEESFYQKEVGLLATFLNYKQGSDNIYFDEDILTKNKEEHKYKKWFKKMAAFTITAMVLILFTGHQLLNHYVGNLAEKESKYSMAQQIVLQMNQLKEERLLKEKILENSGVIDANYITKYFVEIGNAITNDITITSIDFAPTEKKIKRNEKVRIDKSVIYISGESYNDDKFNLLVKRLDNIDWVKKVDINYTEDRFNNAFKIKLSK